ALTGYFRYLYVPAPHTIYRHARKLLPGHILTVENPRDPLPPPVPYWSLDEVASRGISTPLACSEEDAVELGDRLLQETVAGAVYADVPVGAFLSGGIDSSLVVACMQAATSRPVKTFSIAFREKEYNEAPHAARVAHHLGTDHTELTLTADEARAVVPRLAEIFDEPFASPSAIPNLLVSELARRHVTVALSGAGGDELFGGYNRYTYGAELLGRLTRVPRVARRFSAAAIGSLRPETWNRLYGVAAPVLPRSLRHRLPGIKLAKLGLLLDEPTPMAMYRSLVSAWPEPERLVVAGRERPGLLARALANGPRGAHWLDRLMLADQLTYLPDDQLAMVDRASMAVSLEVRVPFLERPMIEFAWRLPARLKARNGQGKWLLRQMLYRRVPRELVDRPKMGLSVPIEAWLRGPLRGWADALLDPDRLERQGILRAGPIRDAWTAFQAGRAHTALPLWTAIVFQAWAERWLP
ncbi:MAG: asparagine synthetase B family protein, partial [Candidatus Rokuibacteriota bacterium]